MTGPSFAGYSKTPLPKKLGIRDGARVGVMDPPVGLEAMLGPLPASATLAPVSDARGCDVVVAFVHSPDALVELVRRATRRMAPTSSIWICWPKKSSRLFCGVSGNEVRAAGLSAKLVDIKVAALSDDWSGLKFVVPVANRPHATRKK